MADETGTPIITLDSAISQMKQSVQSSSSTAEKDTPDYQSKTYTEQLPFWQYARNIKEGAWLQRDGNGLLISTDLAMAYLPKDPAESPDEWLVRYQLTPYEDLYAQALRKFVSLLFSGGMELRGVPQQLWLDRTQIPPDVYATIAPHWDDIDLEGTDGNQFILNFAEDLLTEGFRGIFIDYSGDFVPQNEQQRIDLGFRPYWVPVAPQDFINFKLRRISGVKTLVQCTIRSIEERFVGDFVTEERFVYRTYTLRNKVAPETGEILGLEVFWQKFERAKDAIEGLTAPIAVGVIDLPYIPFVDFYGGKKQAYAKASPPLLALAQLNHVLYRLTSDDLRYTHLCALPIPTVNDALGEVANKGVVLGPNKIISFADPNGRFRWEELSGSSLAVLDQRIARLRRSIDIVSASFLETPSDRQAAFTTEVQMSATDSGLEMFARQLALGINRCLKIHADYLQLSLPGYCVINSGVTKELGRDSQLLMAYSRLFEQGVLSRRMLMSLLKALNFFPDWFNIDDAIAEADYERSLQPAPAPFDASGVNALLNLALKDGVSKRTLLLMLTVMGVPLPPDFDVDEEIKKTGEDFNILPVGSMGSQPATFEAIATAKKMRPSGGNKKKPFEDKKPYIPPNSDFAPPS